MSGKVYRKTIKESVEFRGWGQACLIDDNGCFIRGQLPVAIMFNRQVYLAKQ